MSLSFLTSKKSRGAGPSSSDSLNTVAPAGSVTTWIVIFLSSGSGGASTTTGGAITAASTVTGGGTTGCFFFGGPPLSTCEITLRQFVPANGTRPVAVSYMITPSA